MSRNASWQSTSICGAALEGPVVVLPRRQTGLPRVFPSLLRIHRVSPPLPELAFLSNPC